MTAAPAVMFVCVRNSGKSQMAAALMRAVAGNRVAVHSAGTDPGQELNALSVQALGEVGVEVGDEHPKPVDPALLARMDVVVVLGREARLGPVDGARIRYWDTDEPSERGIGGMERMRLVRDDIAARIQPLFTELTRRPPAAGGTASTTSEHTP